MIKKEYTLALMFLEFITRYFENTKTCQKLKKKCPTNVPTAGRGKGVSKLWDSVPGFAPFFILKASLRIKVSELIMKSVMRLS